MQERKRRREEYFMRKPEGKSMLLFFAVVLFLFASPVFSNDADTEQQKETHREWAKKIVVAKVNGAVISLDDLMQLISYMSAKKAQGSDTPEDREQLRKDALNRLINQALVLQKAKAEGLKVDEKKIDEAMANLKKKMNGAEGYKEFLEKEQATEADMRARAERSLILDLVYAREILGKLSVSEDEAKKKYEMDKDKFVVPEKIVVTDVVFFLDLNEEAAGKAGKILDQIRRDKNQDPLNVPAEDIFIVREMELTLQDGQLYEEAKKLRVGELSGVIRMSDSFHIIKLKVFSPLKQFSFEEVKGVVMKKLMNEARQKRFKEWEADLRKDAKIEIMDEKDSDK